MESLIEINNNLIENNVVGDVDDNEKNVKQIDSIINQNNDDDDDSSSTTIDNHINSTR